MFYQSIYKIFPSLGINAQDLAKVMIYVGTMEQEKRIAKSIMENSDLRDLVKQIKLKETS